MSRPTPPPISELRLDRLIRDALAERAHEVAARAIPAEAVTARTLTRRRSHLDRSTLVLVTAGLILASLLGGLLATGGIRFPWGPDRSFPNLGLTSPLPSASLATPQGSPDTEPTIWPSDVPSQPGWTGPLRPGVGPMPVLAPIVHVDEADAAAGWVDIAWTQSGTNVPPGYDWTIGLAEKPPRAATLDPARLVIEFGVVLDADRDGVADCHIGINNRTNRPGDYRVWVTDLETRTTAYQAGPPYGVPIDFAHPDEGGSSMRFFFLRGAGAPCRLAPGMGYYTYAVAMEGARVLAWDFAPDEAWVGMAE